MRRRAGQTLAACFGTLLLTLILAAKYGTFQPDRTAPVKAQIAEQQCEPLFVDWNQFSHPPPDTLGGSATIFAVNFEDSALPWLVRGLHSLKYYVKLLCKPEDEDAARSFLLSQPTSDIQLQLVTVHHQMLNASISKVFVNLWESTTMPLVAGRGLVNLLIMPTVSKVGSGSNYETNQSTICDVVFGSYDYMIARSAQDRKHHTRALIPAMERIQLLHNMMFPLTDIIHFPGSAVQESVSKQFEAKFFQVVHRSFLTKVIRFFMNRSLGAYKARVSPAKQKVRATQAQAKLGHQRYAAVIVEARPHYALLYTVLNAAWFLPGWKLHVVHTHVNDGHVQRMLQPYVDVSYHLLDTDNVDIDQYNRLMKNASFWLMLKADHVQLFQTDSLILRHGLEKFAEFDYIGAPWHLENERWSKPELKAALPSGVGNGGFSMRSINAMASIAKMHGQQSPLKEQEDVFFARQIQASNQFVVADRKSAYMYCLEVPCHDLERTYPHALHAAWYYNDISTMQQLLDSSLYSLSPCI